MVTRIGDRAVTQRVVRQDRSLRWRSRRGARCSGFPRGCHCIGDEGGARAPTTTRICPFQSGPRAALAHRSSRAVDCVCCGSLRHRYGVRFLIDIGQVRQTTSGTPIIGISMKRLCYVRRLRAREGPADTDAAKRRLAPEKRRSQSKEHRHDRSLPSAPGKTTTVRQIIGAPSWLPPATHLAPCVRRPDRATRWLQKIGNDVGELGCRKRFGSIAIPSRPARPTCLAGRAARRNSKVACRIARLPPRRWRSHLLTAGFVTERWA